MRLSFCKLMPFALEVCAKHVPHFPSVQNMPLPPLSVKNIPRSSSKLHPFPSWCPNHPPTFLLLHCGLSLLHLGSAVAFGVLLVHGVGP